LCSNGSFWSRSLKQEEGEADFRLDIWNIAAIPKSQSDGVCSEKEGRDEAPAN